MKLAEVTVPVVLFLIPEPVIDTVSVAFAVFVSPEYCTLMVQELPGLIANPLTQVPPG